MRINNIEINNFGAYEGKVILDTLIQSSKQNIVLIGGKNGAGKTTLFTAIRLCIYGCQSFGYQSINAFYVRNIAKLINNAAKRKLPAYASVKVDMSINNGLDNDSYIILREWNYIKNSSVNEKLSVIKNGIHLKNAALHDFEKFITQIIPPDLFNLYFFDGEKIADFFLDEGGNTRFKNAFLTLCGYDTFEIMSRNFHRVHDKSEDISHLSDQYFQAKEDKEIAESNVSDINLSKDEIIRSIETIESKISSLDTDYKKSGGVTQEEWDRKFQKLKEEEMRRDEANTWLKKIANEILPFLIVRDQLVDVQTQIHTEEEYEKIDYFIKQICKQETQNLLIQAFLDNDVIITSDVLKKVIAMISGELDVQEKYKDIILKLSPDEKVLVLHTISQLLNFNQKEIADKTNEIKASIKHSQQIREDLENCNIDTVQQYITQRNSYISEKDALIKEYFKLIELLKTAEAQRDAAEDNYERVKKLYEDELKKASINDTALKAIMMLDKLQEKLYFSQIAKLQEVFHKEISRLTRKTNLVDEIIIDEKFDIHIYRKEVFTGDTLYEMFNTFDFDKLCSILGQRAIDIVKTNRLQGYKRFIPAAILNISEIELPVEIEKNSLSNGEKQIFIMALYKALMSLCNHEVPFVIDTPFARIDTEHRQNIVQYFFKELKGQVFILSTNEEISKEHLDVLRDKILIRYTLENDDNKQTIVSVGKYFEEE